MIGNDPTAAVASRQLGESRWIENVCTEFECAWRGGQRPRIEDLLPTAEPHLRERLLDELLAVELELKFTESESPDVASYHERFPNDKPRIERLFQSVRADCQEAERRAARLAAIQPLDERDHYQLGDEIARGGMGIVFRCRDVVLGRDLALKTLLPEHQDRTEAVLRFVNEARISARLQHPGIPPVHELGRLRDGRPFLTMKLVSGRTFAEFLNRPDRDLANEIQRRMELDIFHQVCRTMAFAHSQGIIHRDLKPANIMVGAFDEVQVMDWGLARELPAETDTGGRTPHQRIASSVPRQVAAAAAPMVAVDYVHNVLDPMESCDTKLSGTSEGLTAAGAILGTLSYMPPEQARSEQLDCRADVFSLGAILCELLTGKPPHWSESADDALPSHDAARIAQVAEGNLLSVALQRLKNCGADPELVQLTGDCLQADLRYRPANAGEVLERLNRLLNSFDTESRTEELTATNREPWTTEAVRRARLARWLAVLFLLVTIGSVITAIGFWNGPLAPLDAVNHRREAGVTNTEVCAADSPRSTPAEPVTESPAVAEFTPFLHQSKGIVSVAYNPRGDRLASAASTWSDAENRHTNWEIKLWEASTGRCLRDFTGHTNAVRAVAFSHDGQRLATASHDHTTKIWDIESGEEVLTLKGHNGVCWTVAFSPNGEWIATGGADKQVILWNARDGNQVRTLTKHQGIVGHVTFSSDGTRLASSAFDATVRVWDTASGEELACFVTEHNNFKRGAAFNPDGTRLVTIGGNANCQVWYIATRDVISELNSHGANVLAVDWSQDGRLIATCGANEVIQIWDATTGTELQTWAGFSGWVYCLAFRPDNQELACGQGSLLHRWNLSTGRALVASENSMR